MGIRYADHVTPLYPQKLALTSPTGGGRSVGIVRLQTKATEFSLVLFEIEGGDRDGTVVKVLCYKSEDRWFDSRWCHWNFSLT